MLSKSNLIMALCGTLVCGGCIAKVEKKIPVYLDAVQDVSGADQHPLDLPGDSQDVADNQEVGGDGLAETVDLVPVETAKVLPAGGHFLLEGGVELLVPAGAVTEEAGIEIEAIKVPGATLPDGAQAVSDVWSMEPQGTAFAKPITVGLPRAQGSVDVQKWTLLKGLVGGEEDFSVFEQVPAWGNPEGSVVYIQTLHFSLVAAVLAESGGTVVCGDVEYCNGKDDDCDGATDEAPLDAMGQSCRTQGVCEGKEVASCSDGTWVCGYEGIEGFEESEESCDGKDNDCDGSIDEGLAGEADSVEGDTCLTEGVCQAVAPFAYCVMGEWFCDYGEVPGYQGAVELTCDGVDNNCDGTADEAACEGLEVCATGTVCVSGLCVLPFGELGGKFCTWHPGSCLVRDGADLVEVADGATRCTGATQVALCDGGLWSPATACSEAFPGTFKCDSEIGACAVGCDVDEDCVDDGDVCNGVPACIDHQCVLDPTSVKVCPGDDCNQPSCNPITGVCSTTPKNQGGECDEGLKCTIKGTCNSGTCINQNAVNCNDNRFCTTDSCNPDTGDCLHDPAPLVGFNCSDGVNCTFGDKCNAAGDCVGSVNTCDDGTECTFDECVEATGLCNNDSVIKEGFSCSDGNPCTLNDKCLVGACAGAAKTCLDTNDCTLDGCDPVTGDCTASPTNSGGSCDYPNNAGNPDPCTPQGSCNSSGACLPGPDLCECRSDADCVAHDNGDKCDGIMRCNLMVAPYTCYFDASTVVYCSPASDTACRKNTCVPATGACGMKDVPDGSLCSDNNACTTSDKCKSGACTDVQQVTCDDGDACTLNQCDPGTGCVYPDAPNTTPCEDGDPCTLYDTCDGAGECIPGTPKTPACDDANVCTDNSCTPDGLSCLFSPIAGCCLLDSECSSPDVCFQNACCTPQCAGKECGDDGCGGLCGSCQAWEECVSAVCECPDCCESTSECALNEVCDTLATIPVCTAKTRLFSRGFEGEPVGTSGIPPSGFLFSYTNAGSNPNPWKVRNFTNGANCNSGTYVLQYYKSGSLNSSGTLTFWHFLPGPAQTTTKILSFYTLCPSSANPPHWSMTLLVNDAPALTFDQSTSCTGAYIRRVVDLAALNVSGTAKFTFNFTKIATTAVVSLYVDDLAIFVDDCPDDYCVTFTETAGVCVPGTPAPGTCYIDGACWDTNDPSPNFTCLNCISTNNQTSWTADSALCPVGQVCDPAYSATGCKLP